MTRSEALAKKYLEWLAPQMNLGEGHRYHELLELLQAKEFTWFVPNDNNRLMDGLDIRFEFMREKKVKPSAYLADMPCTFLEVIIALSRRLAFVMSTNDAPPCAWRIIENLELDSRTDPLFLSEPAEINTCLDRVIQRTYNPDGSGGFFPLAWPEADQREVEIWYQMNAYVLEMQEV